MLSSKVSWTIEFLAGYGKLLDPKSIAVFEDTDRKPLDLVQQVIHGNHGDFGDFLALL